MNKKEHGMRIHTKKLEPNPTSFPKPNITLKLKTLNHQPSTLPSTLNPHPQPQTLNPDPRTLNPKTLTLNPQP